MTTDNNNSLYSLSISFLRLRINILVLLICFGFQFHAQEATIAGTVKGIDGEPLEHITIGFKELPQERNETDSKGHYSIIVPANRTLSIIFFEMSHSPVTYTFMAKPGETLSFSPVMKFRNELGAVVVNDFNKRSEEVVILSTQALTVIPTVRGDVEDLVKTQMGVTSSNELSSGYSVRGGNYDENLVYVNDIEVYRPFLVRSGQQEGLSFANPNMVQKLSFSAGGFESKYGDKLSSVLDITYRKPRQFSGNASASLLGGNVQAEGIGKKRLVAWSIGARYRTNIYLLKSLDTKGEYRPSALDVQTFLTFDISPKWKMEFLGSINNNKYLVIPTNRQTDFGTVKDALRFTVYFDGQELMEYTTYMAGLSTTYKPKKRVQLKLITSAYHSNEQEVYTVQGQYFIDQLEADLGKPNFGQVAFNRGIGTFLNNGRNYLSATVFNIEHKGTYTLRRHNELLWGLRQQAEKITDQLGEWRTIDSAGYIVPYSPNAINLIDVYKTHIGIQSGRTQGYLQYNYFKTLRDSSRLRVTVGVRGNYWTLNEQTVISPRFTVSFEPNWKRDWLFKLSGGYYYQPPFYREIRNIDGTVNTNVKAQLSQHLVLTGDYNFKMWNRPFKLMMAAYWKELSSIVPYEIDNVRIRYFANNNTKGYATGADIRINGEFVGGVESWATLGVLRTYEYSKNNIHYDYYNKDGEKIVKGYTFDQAKADSVKVDPGYIPRPTDQLVTFGMFFQDHLPRYPFIKFNLNLQFGSGLPFGPPTHLRWQQVLRMPPYRRADAGIAYNVLKSDREKKRKNIFNNLKELWVFLEVFNLLQVQNTVSYTWVMDVTGNRYAIPNYLTNRQLNARIQIKF
jgi:hypothetical protein